MLAHRPGIGEIVVRLDQSVEELLFGGAPHLADLERTELLESAVDRRLVHVDRRRTRPASDVVRRSPANFRELDVPRAVKLQHQAATDHVAQRAIGLAPIPRLAQELRQLSPARARVRRDQRADEIDLHAGDRPASILQLHFHGRGA